MPRTELDVAIVGAGLAGNLLAYQLTRSVPGLRIGLFDKETPGAYKVGESTAEIAGNYLMRRLGLSSYLYEEHLPKNGLRYFLDTAGRDGDLSALGEIGSTSIPIHPGFQLDRSRLERELLARNQQAGVDLYIGEPVEGAELGSGQTPHKVALASGAKRSCRWLADATGRLGLVARAEGLRVPEPWHRVGSVWGRFENVEDLDVAGSADFRARVSHTHRRLSTVHFWYRGYWVWFIPLRGGLTSVGITGRLVAERSALRTPEGFRAFLDEHRAIRCLLRDAKLVDLGSYARISYGASQFLGRDRLALVGEAASATDPLYSPGSDFIALENDFFCDLVRREESGERAELIDERRALYDAFIRYRHEATMRLYRGLYGVSGSFELASAKWVLDIGSYYNLWASSYMRDEHMSMTWLRSQVRDQDVVFAALDRFAALFQRAEAELDRRGTYHAGNLDRFRHGLEDLEFYSKLGTRRRRKEVFETLENVFNRARSLARGALGEPSEALSLGAFISGESL